MAHAVEATRQDIEQEAADELVRRERHDALPLRTIAAVVFVAEGRRSRCQIPMLRTAASGTACRTGL